MKRRTLPMATLEDFGAIVQDMNATTEIVEGIPEDTKLTREEECVLNELRHAAIKLNLAIEAVFDGGEQR